MMAIGTGDGPPDLEAAIRLADRYRFHLRHRRRPSARRLESRRPKLSRACASWPAHPKVVAIGEIGLDYHYDFSPRDVQRAVFERQLAIAAEAGQAHRDPHPRSLGRHAATCCGEHWHGGGIMHCFTGDAAQARQALDLGFHLSFGGVLTFPKAEAVREAARITPGRSAAGRDRLPVSGARAAPRQAQRTGLRGGDRAPPGGGARRHAGGDRRAHHSQFRAACVCAGGPVTGKLVNLHEFRQAGAGPDRSRDFRPDPGRPGAGGKEDHRRIGGVGGCRHRHRPVSAIERRQAPAPRAAAALRQAAAATAEPTADPAGRGGGNDPRRHAGARRRDRHREDAPRPPFDQRASGAITPACWPATGCTCRPSRSRCASAISRCSTC